MILNLMRTIKTAYAELKALDERSLMLTMSEAPNDGRKALKILRKHHASTEKQRVLTVYEELTTMVMSDLEDITNYIIKGERASTGLHAGNQVIAMLLKGLPKSFRPFVVVHTQLDKVKTLTEFKSQLRNNASTEAMRKEHSTVLPAHRSSHYSGNKPNSNPCNACGDKDHNTSECNIRTSLTCTYCKKPYHNGKTATLRNANSRNRRPLQKLFLGLTHSHSNSSIWPTELSPRQ